MSFGRFYVGKAKSSGRFDGKIQPPIFGRYNGP